MIVYIDLVIISTIVTDYAILKIISEVWNEKIKILRLLISIIISIINLFLFIFPLKHFVLIRYFSGIIVPIICFKHKTIKDTIIKIVTYYILNIFYVGTLIVFNISTFGMLFPAVLFICICFIVENYKNITINENQFIYNVSINNKTYKSYLDTGNMMYYDGIPVVIANIKIYNPDIYIPLANMKVTSVSDSNLINIYKGPPIKIKNIEYIVYYTFNNNIDYDIILHKDCR